LFFGEDQGHWRIPVSKMTRDFSDVIPGRVADANPESRGSGFDASRRPGTTGRLRPRQIEDALGDDAEHHL
jgi:hypothetical protein